MATVSFIGLGVMGYPMAGHLKTKGSHELRVYNRTADKAKKWAEQFGGTACATPAWPLAVAVEDDACGSIRKADICRTAEAVSPA